MNKKITAPRIFVGVLLLFVVALISVMLILPSFGYFKVVFDRMGVNTSRVELIFDRLDFESSNVTGATLEDGTTARFNSSAEWGSEQNPYVINQKHHVQNLSVLQNNGFFKERVRTDPTTGEPVLGDDGKPIPEQSFFLVCTPDGLPVAIDCEGISIAPIGTHENPFTGNIQGAFVTGEATYNYTPRKSGDGTTAQSYGVSVSTIGNLIVEASVSEPDIGFFGCVGYYGTEAPDESNNNYPTVTGGYAAHVENFLLADVTVSSAVTITDALTVWWANFTDHNQSGYNTEAETDDLKESHHVGVVAGHAEFATINNISVYYSPGVQTFALSGATNTNYYSSTGLLGLLRFVNPTITSGGSLVGDSTSISDKDMVEGGLGGGGTISGTLTGYMLAETLFNEHEQYIAVEDRENIYDVKEMVDRNGEPLFSTVTMKEGTYFTNENVTYYYFSDSVFTFTMSSSSKSTGSNIDYVQKLWDLSDESSRPSVSGTDELADWQYTQDENAKTRYAYKLTVVTDATELNNGSGGYYVIAYHDKGSTDAQADDVLYILPVRNPDTPKGIAQAFAFSEFYESTDNNVSTTWDGLEITEVSLPGTETKFFDYSFLNTAGRTLSDPYSSDYALSLYSERTGFLWFLSDFEHPTAPEMSNLSNISVDGDGSQEAMVTNWQFKRNTETGKFAIYATYSFWGASYHTRGAVALGFENETFTFPFLAQDELNSSETIAYSLENSYLFTIFRLTPNTETDGTVNLASGNFKIDPMSMKPSGETEYEFDPSQYVFQNVLDANGAPTGNYTLAPIASYNLNSGKGTLLTELNHVVKLYQATSKNYQLKLSNTFIGGLLGDVLDTNSGGVVEVQVGVTEPPVYATIPAGMLAFNIMEASPDKPSYINIIVAINPEQLSPCTIGLWQMPGGDEWEMDFDLSAPDQSFALPISHYATSQTASTKYTIPVTQYTKNEKDASGNYITEVGNSYVYLNGEVAFVYHTFAVEEAGIYYVGSGNGPMSVSYFSVSGAAGAGADGTSASPLGDIDFVYAYDGDIITVDKKFTGVQDINNEDYSLYYPSYNFITMIPKDENGNLVNIQNEAVYAYRYIADSSGVSPPNSASMTDSSGTKRHLYIYGTTQYTATKTVADMYGDDLD